MSEIDESRAISPELQDGLRRCSVCEEVADEEFGGFLPDGEWSCEVCYDDIAVAAIEWCEATLAHRATRDEKADKKARRPRLDDLEWRTFHERYRAVKRTAWKAEEKYRAATGRPPFALRDEDEDPQ